MNAGIGHNGGPVMLKPAIELRWYQEEAVQSLFDFFNDPVRAHSLEPANPLICMPTGTGKSVVIAEFLRRALMTYPQTRAIVATHVKELVRQNAKKLMDIWPLAPVGIHSAGLSQRDTMQPIIFGGVQSMVGKFPLFGWRDLLAIDEAHLLSPNGDTSYQKFIDELSKGPVGADPSSRNVNPYLKVIGFTATPYRLGLGHMTNGNMFTHVAYDLCTIDAFNRLMAEGYLSPVIPQRTDQELDVSNVGLRNGDFIPGQLQDAIDKETITYGALKQVINKGHDRRSWLLFASGVEHAEHISEMLNNVFGVSCVAIHSGNSKEKNDKNLELWQTGQVRAAVNMNSLTTGVDHPACDLIAVLRPTMSTGLWVQMIGRGTRPFNWFMLSPAEQQRLILFQGFIKQNCLVLDFAGNTRRLGPINDPVIPKPKGKGPPGDAPVKICDACGTYNHATAKLCIGCGKEFDFSENISRKASELELLRSNLPQIEPFTVDRVVLVPHTSNHSGNGSIKVAYYCGLRTFYEWISVESPSNLFRKRSRDWFRQRYHYQTPQLTWDNDVPLTNKEVLDLATELRWPSRINVWLNKEKPEIMGYEF